MVERAEPVQGAVGWLPDPVQQRQSWLVGLPSKQPALRRTLLLDNLGLQLPLLSSRPALRPGSHMAATGEPASPLSWVVYVGLAANAKREQNGDGGHQQDPQGGSRRPSQDQQRTQPCLLRRPPVGQARAPGNAAAGGLGRTRCGGRSTEADQVVGRISVDGTLGHRLHRPVLRSGLPDCGAGCPLAGPVASPSVPCSWPWPVSGWSCCVPATRIDLMGPGWCRWPASPRWWSSWHVGRRPGRPVELGRAAGCSDPSRHRRACPAAAARPAGMTRGYKRAHQRRSRRSRRCPLTAQPFPRRGGREARWGWHLREQPTLTSLAVGAG
jgi:hypothetical protein